MKTQFHTLINSLLLGLVSFTGVQANTQLDLPDPTANAVLYGDFYSYSLPILASNYDLINGGGVGPGNPFYVDSSPGQISDDIVIATGANGNPVRQNFNGMNWAYETPNSDGITYRSTGETVFHPTNDGLNAAQDNITTWNTTIAALDTYLNGSTFPIWLFNNNQTNSGGSADQNMKVWMQVYMWSSTDPQNVDPLIYTLSNNCPFTGGTTPGVDLNLCIEGGEISFTQGGIVAGPDKDPSLYDRDLADNPYPISDIGAGTTPTFDDFVISGGEVCLNDTLGIPVNCSEPHDRSFAHNLGANQAAYAVYSQELNDMLAQWRLGNLAEYDMLSIDLRLGCNPNPGNETYDCTDGSLNNGYEQVFLGRGEFDPPPPSGVPVPPALFLFLSGGAMLAFKRKK